MMLTKEKSNWIVAAGTLTAATLLIASFSTGANAETRTSIKNLDQKAYRLTIVEGDNRKVVELQPMQELTGICGTTCLLSVGDDPDPYEVVVNDKVEIEQGEVLYQSDDTEDQTSDESTTSDDPEPEGDTSGDETPDADTSGE